MPGRGCSCRLLPDRRWRRPAAAGQASYAGGRGERRVETGKRHFGALRVADRHRCAAHEAGNRAPSRCGGRRADRPRAAELSRSRDDETSGSSSTVTPRSRSIAAITAIRSLSFTRNSAASRIRWCLGARGGNAEDRELVDAADQQIARDARRLQRPLPNHEDPIGRRRSVRHDLDRGAHGVEHVEQSVRVGFRPTPRVAARIPVPTKRRRRERGRGEIARQRDRDSLQRLRPFERYQRSPRGA